MIIFICDKKEAPVNSVITDKGHRTYIPENNKEAFELIAEGQQISVPFGGGISFYTDNGEQIARISDNRN